MDLGLLTDDQLALSSGIIGKYLSDPLLLADFQTKNSSLENIVEYKLASILPRKDIRKCVLTKSGSVDEMKSSIDLTRFLIPTISLTFIQKNKQASEEESKHLTKIRLNDFVGRGKTSYRIRPQQLAIEDSVVSNTVFNRTHYLLMFGALGSMTNASDDEGETDELAASGTRFNPCGNKLDALADEDNCTDYDLVTMAKYPGTYSSSQQNIVMNFRLKFLHSLSSAIRQFTEIKLLYPFNFKLKPADFKFYPFDYSDYALVASILTAFSHESTIFRDFDITQEILSTFTEFIGLGIKYPNAPVHFVCEETILRFIYITHLFICNLAYGMRGTPYSLFDYLSRSQTAGLGPFFTEIENEAAILARQVDIGGLYCFELKEFQSLAVCASFSNFANLIAIASEILSSGHTTKEDIAHATSLTGDLYSVRITFEKPQQVIISCSKFRKVDTFLAVFPLWNMNDNANKYASDTNEIIFLPW